MGKISTEYNGLAKIALIKIICDDGDTLSFEVQQCDDARFQKISTALKNPEEVVSLRDDGLFQTLTLHGYTFYVDHERTLFIMPVDGGDSLYIDAEAFESFSYKDGVLSIDGGRAYITCDKSDAMAIVSYVNIERLSTGADALACNIN